MKKTVLFISALIISTCLFSQNEELTSVKTSKIFHPEKLRNLKGFYRLKNGKTVTVRDIGEYLEIITYDEDFNQIGKSDPVKFTYKQNEGKNYFKKTYLTKDDKVIIIFEQKFKKKKKMILWANILNLEDEELELSEPVKLFEISYKTQIYDYHIRFNDERSKFVVVNYELAKDPHENNILGFQVFNTDLEKIWATTLDEIFVYSSPAGMFRITDDGKVIAVLPVKDETVRKLDKTQQKSLFFIYIFDKEGNIQSNLSLKMKENIFIKDFNISVENNVLRAVGCYAENIRSNYSVGTINFSIDLNDGEESGYKIHEFPVDAIFQYESEKVKEHYKKMKEKGEKNPGLAFLSVIKILPHKNGYYAVFQKRVAMVNTKTGITTYDYRDYFVFSFSDDDQLLWVRKIPIQLRSTVENYYSEYIFCIDDDICFLHFDSEKSFTNFEEVKKGKRWPVADCLVFQKFNSDGESSKELVYKNSDLGLSKYVPYHYMTATADSDAVFLFFSGKDAEFLEVTIEE